MQKWSQTQGEHEWSCSQTSTLVTPLRWFPVKLNTVSCHCQGWEVGTCKPIPVSLSRVLPKVPPHCSSVNSDKRRAPETSNIYLLQK